MTFYVYIQKNGQVSLSIFILNHNAEDEGFKPPIPVMGIPDFESSAFGHSANLPLTRLISPKHVLRALFFVCKDNIFFPFGKEILTQKRVFQAAISIVQPLISLYPALSRTCCHNSVKLSSVSILSLHASPSSSLRRENCT